MNNYEACLIHCNEQTCEKPEDFVRISHAQTCALFDSYLCCFLTDKFPLKLCRLPIRSIIGGLGVYDINNLTLSLNHEEHFDDQRLDLFSTESILLE